jgi:hypothetical protein
MSRPLYLAVAADSAIEISSGGTVGLLGTRSPISPDEVAVRCFGLRSKEMADC